MKKLLFTLVFSISSILSFGQMTMDIHNNTNCNLRVDMSEYDPFCGFVVRTIHNVPAGAIVTAIAPNGFDFSDADIIDGSSGCLITNVSSMSAPPCVQCTGAYPPTVTAAGCGGCITTLTADWLPGCPMGPNHGVIEIF